MLSKAAYYKCRAASESGKKLIAEENALCLLERVSPVRPPIVVTPQDQQTRLRFSGSGMYAVVGDLFSSIVSTSKNTDGAPAFGR